MRLSLKILRKFLMFLKVRCDPLEKVSDIKQLRV